MRHGISGVDDIEASLDLMCSMTTLLTGTGCFAEKNFLRQSHAFESLDMNGNQRI